MEDIFAKTMRACLENKKTAKAPTSKKLTESKKVVAPKRVATKKVQPKTVVEKRFLREGDFDAEMADLDEYEVNVQDENEVVDDLADDIVVVVDPELDNDEMAAAAEDAQEIINGTEEGEVPTSDEYIGSFTYTCPICGNTFFSANELNAGDACPVCGDTPDNFVLVGKVETTEDFDDFNDEEEEEVVDETEVDVDEEPAEDDGFEEVDVDETEETEEEPEEDKTAEEKFSRRFARPVRKENRKPMTRRPMPTRRVAPTRSRVENKRVPAAPARRIVRRSLNLDESTFNPYLMKFVRENYSNVKAFKLYNAKLAKNVLTLECKLTYASGRTKKVTLKGEGFVRSGKCILNVRDDGTFKVTESKKAPILLKLNTANNVVKCEGMRYDFKTVCEGRKYRVASKAIVESARAARR